MAPDVSIVIVSFNNLNELLVCLRSIASATHAVSYEIVVVDNASREDNVRVIRSSFPEVVLIANDANHGFAAACNQGIAASRGQFVLLLNPDTELRADAISAVVAFLQAREDASIASCRLTNADGTMQESIGVFPNIAEAFLGATFLSHLLPRNVLMGKKGLVRIDTSAPMRIDWATGAFLLFKSDVIGRLGGLDEQFFLYTEETDFCYRAARAGLGVWYVPYASVVHHWAGMNSVTRRNLLWLLASQILFLKKHYRAGERQCLIFLKYLGVIVRIPVNGVLGVLTLNPVRLRKVGYYAYALWRLLTTSWHYEFGKETPVIPWTRKW
jgi:hypothetical protein